MSKRSATRLPTTKLALLGGTLVVFLGASRAHAAGHAPGALPPEEVVSAAFAAAPRLQIAHESIDQGAALERRLRAGPHEWEVEALGQQRTDADGREYDEQLYGVQRGIRWPWKASLDRQIGSTVREAGELSYTDAWHEAGRDLLDQWFAWMDADLGGRLIDEQLQVLVRQQQSVQRRVDSGDAAALELQLAAAETRRLQVQRNELSREEMLARETLVREFPALPVQLPDSIDEPVPISEPDAVWLQRITADNHEIDLAQMRADRARLEAERAGRDRLPDPTLALRYSDNIDGNHRLLGLSVTMPLGGRARTADAALARSAARMAENTALRTRTGVESAARMAIATARISYRNWQESSEAASQMQATAEATARGYELGELDIAVLLAARRQSLEARRQQISAQLAALLAWARLRLDAHLLWVPPNHSDDHEDAGR